MTRPWLLDMFCGAGGASVGYHRAGFNVVGVDREPQPNYPFAFYQGDAMEFPLDGFAFIHASPPCQAYTVAAKIHDSAGRHPDLCADVRERLRGRRYVIENVIGAPLQHSVVLCGTMFGLRVFRHRAFECSELLMIPPHTRHIGTTLAKDKYSSFAGGATHICVAGNNFSRADAEVAMGIDWMRTREEIVEAIPPAYTEYIGRQLIDRLQKGPA